MDKFRPHDVVREDRADGTILLRAGYPMGPVARCCTDWLVKWAARTPDAVFLAERSGAGWRAVTYAEALSQVRALAQSLLAMELDGPLLILSGNSINHGLLVLAAQWIGLPFVPVAEQYALIPGALKQLQHVVALTRPALVYAEDGVQFAQALTALEIPALVSVSVPKGTRAFADFLRGDSTDIDAANAAVTPDTVAKYLMTSGSTSMPKAVITTQRMLCVNQTQILDAMPFLRQRPPRIVDWLPWNHVFGGSHNFNLMLANGGALYIDGGKPAPHLIGQSLENNRLIGGTIAFNVPVGFAQFAAAMQDDAALRQRYFQDLDMLFYAGASLQPEVWDALAVMAREVRGDVPLFTSSWGLTETAPAALSQHEEARGAGIVGVPVSGTTVKLVPEGARYDVRVKGPQVTCGYLNDADKTAEAFDAEGFFISGDAMTFIDAGDPNKGLRFESRTTEEFKLGSGTWVRAPALRLELLGLLKGLAQDIVLVGEGQSELGALVVPMPAMREDAEEVKGALIGPGPAQIAARLALQPATGSASSVARMMVLAASPSMAEGEATAKGNLNFATLKRRRADLIARLFAGGVGVYEVP